MPRKPRKRKTHCKNGHPRIPETINGTNCMLCTNPHYQPRNGICVRGHKRTPDNVYKNGACKECMKIFNRKGTSVYSSD